MIADALKKGLMSLPKNSRPSWHLRLGGAVLLVGLQASDFVAYAQHPAPARPDATSEAPSTQPEPAPTPTHPSPKVGPDRATLQALREHLDLRRLELDQEREALSELRVSLEAVDIVAEPEAIATWRAVEDDSRARENRNHLLSLLAQELTAEALQAVALPQLAEGQLIAPQERKLVWTRLAANLRRGPAGDGEPLKVLEKSTPVVIVAHHAAGGWSLVASPFGFGFVLHSQLLVDQ